MEFLQDLTEAKLIGRSKNGLRRFDARELADLLFLHLCALQILKHEFLGLPKAQEYIKLTGPLTNFDYFVASRNELYVLIHVLIGKNAESARKFLKNQEANDQLFNRIKINMQLTRKYLRLILAGKIDESFERRYFMMMEKDLNITNNYYRSIRRLVMTWPKQSRSTRKLVMTRLLQIMRTKGRRSEMMNILEWLSKQKQLEDPSLKPLEGEGPGQKVKAEPEPKKGMGFLKKLAIAGVAGAAGAYGGYKLVRRDRKSA